MMMISDIDGNDGDDDSSDVMIMAMIEVMTVVM